MNAAMIDHVISVGAVSEMANAWLGYSKARILKGK